MICLAGVLGTAKEEDMRRELLECAEEEEKRGTSDELWYGTSGVLCSVMFAERYFSDKRGLAEARTRLAHRIAATRIWKWHDKQYHGFVHGTAGIGATLAVAARREREEGGGGGGGEVEAAVRRAEEMLVAARAEDGNYRSSTESEKTTLVHVCHGAPGVALFWMEIGRMEEAEACGEVVWKRGLLRKGVGLCHGISGNGIVLLMLHQKTGKKIWLDRAVAFWIFAEQQCRRPDDDLVMQPDEPFGLVNGIGGLVCFTGALRHILNGGTKEIRMPFF